MSLRETLSRLSRKIAGEPKVPDVEDWVDRKRKSTADTRAELAQLRSRPPAAMEPNFLFGHMSGHTVPRPPSSGPKNARGIG